MSDETLLETRRSGNRVLKVYYDDDPVSPRESSNLGIMVCDHPRLNLGDVQIKSQEEYDEHLKKAAVALPLYIYEHGNVSISTGPNPFDAQGWDTSRIGTIYTTKERIRECFGDDVPSREKLEEHLRGELEVYTQYLNGEVYRYELLEAKKCDLGEEHLETVDSCGGYYSKDHIYEDTGSADWEVEA